MRPRTSSPLARLLLLGLTTCLLSWSLLAQTLAPAAAQSANAEYPVGIVVVTAIGLERGEADAVARALGDTLQEKLLVQAKMNPKQGAISESCAAKPRCISQVGSDLQARELLFLAVVRLGDRLQMNVTWAEVATGKTQPREPIRVKGTGTEPGLFADVVAGLVPNASERPAGSAGTTADKRTDPDPDPGTPGDKDGTGDSTGDGNDSVGAGALDPTIDPTVGGGPIDRPGKRRLTTGVLIAGGISAVALIGGATFGAMALGTDGGLQDDECHLGPCDMIDDRVDTLRRQVNLSDAFFATALVAGAAAGFLYWRSGNSAKQTVGVVPTRSGVQVSLSRSF